MNLEISPQPSEAEKAAIVAALEADGAEEADPSPWAQGALPQREAEDGDQA